MNHEQQETEKVLLKAIDDFLRARGWAKEGPFFTHPQIREQRFRPWDALSETRSRPMFFGGGLR